MTPPVELTTECVEQTVALGESVGGLLRTGDFVALCGQLGSGKTQFVKGLARGLEVPSDEPVVSPTFVLVREYKGRLKLYHIDAYRLDGAAELFALGIDEMRSEPDTVIALEWADRAPDAVPPDAIRVDLEHVGPTSRLTRIHWADDDRLKGLVRCLRP